MALWRVRKIFKLPVGHRLSKHAGLCKNIHGHNIRVEVQISSVELNKDDMVIDFHDVKTIVSAILERFDHAVLINNSDKEFRKFAQQFGVRTIVLEYYDGANVDPTAEVLARYLYQHINSQIQSYNSKLFLDFVRIWENDDGMAEYSE